MVFFFQACKHGRVQHLEHLLFYGADMNIQNSSGNTPLHVAAVNNQVSYLTCGWEGGGGQEHPELYWQHTFTCSDS